MITRRDFCLGLGATGLLISKSNRLLAEINEQLPVTNKSALTQDITRRSPNIKVIGVGGAGVSTVDRILADTSNMTECIIVDEYNTYKPDHILSSAPSQILLPKHHVMTMSNPLLVRKAIEDMVRFYIAGVDMIFIIAGMGGLTGTGAAPVIASIARELGIMTVGVVTMPFSHEGTKVNVYAENGINELREYADTVITIHNDRLIHLLRNNTPLPKLLSIMNDMRALSIKAISDMIFCPGMTGIDFYDVTTPLKNAGNAAMCFGTGKGKNGSLMAAQNAISSPLMSNPSRLKKAKGILLNVTCGPDRPLNEIMTAASLVDEMANTEANIVMGALVDPSMKDRVRVTIIGTGITSLIGG